MFRRMTTKYCCCVLCRSPHGQATILFTPQTHFQCRATTYLAVALLPALKNPRRNIRQECSKCCFEIPRDRICSSDQDIFREVVSCVSYKMQQSCPCFVSAEPVAPSVVENYPASLSAASNSRFSSEVGSCLLQPKCASRCYSLQQPLLWRR